MSEDVVQSACRELLADLDGVRYQSEARFKNWLYTAVFSKIRDKLRHYRAEKRDAAREVRVPSTPGLEGLDFLTRAVESPSGRAMAHEDLEAFAHVVSALPDDYRDIIIKVRVVGMSYEEISIDCGRSEVAVRKLFSRACAHLVRQLGRRD